MHTTAFDQDLVNRPPTRPYLPRTWLGRLAPRRREAAAGLVFWALYVVVDASQWLTLSKAVGARWAAGTVVGVSALEGACWLACTPLVFWLVRRARTLTESVWTRSALLLAAGVPLAFAISYLNLRLRVPPGVLPPDVDQREAKLYTLWLGFLGASAVYAGIAAVGTARAYVRRTQADRDRAARAEAELATAQVDALRRQLDPHFLFNTLNLISALAEDDPRGVRRMISRLGELLRFSLEGAQAPEITVREELALLDRYLDIMRMRFEGRLEIDVRVDDRALGALVPSMILQPLAENGIRHGVEQSRGPGRLEIEAALEEDTIVLRVRDTGPGPARAPRAGEPATPADARRHGVGLRNTVARLERLYGSAGRFALRPDPRGGMVAEVRVPYHSDNELRVAGVSIPQGGRHAA